MQGKFELMLSLAIVLGANWVPLFDGKTLDGWTAKIRGYEYGNNFANTFRVVNGAIQVNYDGYDGQFKDRFGHLFYKTPFSRYKLRWQYRFIGKQLKDGPGWAYKNSGIMFHGQDPATMTLNQEFPVSSEYQLLGGDETGERPTGNLCTPGTNVVYEGKLLKRHVTDSSSKTYRGDVWVNAELEVHGDGEAIHRIEGVEVLRYREIQYDVNDSDGKKLMKKFGLRINRGTISLQSESHPVEFRNIEIQTL